MTAKSAKSARYPAMSAALDKTRLMLVAIGGPRGWSDTKDHWRNKLARKVNLNARRVRAILSNSEGVRLSADEYLQIEQAYSDARASLEALSILAGDAALRAGRAAAGPSRDAIRQSEPTDGSERAAPDAAFRPR